MNEEMPEYVKRAVKRLRQKDLLNSMMDFIGVIIADLEANPTEEKVNVLEMTIGRFIEQLSKLEGFDGGDVSADYIEAVRDKAAMYREQLQMQSAEVAFVVKVALIPMNQMGYWICLSTMLHEFEKHCDTLHELNCVICFSHVYREVGADL